MTYQDNEMLRINQGKRFKQLAKENGMTRDKLSEIIGYVPTHISRLWSGKNTIPDDVAQILAKTFGVRKEYILCIDDFRTIEEMIEGLDNINHDVLLKQLAYLETLGLEVRLRYILFTEYPVICYYKNKLLPYTSVEWYEKLTTDSDYTNPTEESYNKHEMEDKNGIAVVLRKPLPNSVLNQFLTINKEKKYKFNTFDEDMAITLNESNSEFECEVPVIIEVDICYNKQNLGGFTIENMQNFMKVMDAQVKNSIDTFLVQRLKIN